MKTGFVFFSVILVLYKSASVSAACPDGFTQNADRCYLFSVLQVSWIQAMKFCEIYHGELAVVNSEMEQLFLEKYLNSKWRNANQTDGIWISGTDLLVEGEWMWAKSGDPIDYFRWASGQPNSQHMNIGGEDCIALSRKQNFMWDDTPCEYHINFVCERPSMTGPH